MPSTAKTLYFLSSALASAISVIVLGISMSQNWAETTMECARQGEELFNGTAVLTLNLFDGIIDRVSCGNFLGHDEFEGEFWWFLKSGDNVFG